MYSLLLVAVYRKFCIETSHKINIIVLQELQVYGSCIQTKHTHYLYLWYIAVMHLIIRCMYLAYWSLPDTAK